MRPEEEKIAAPARLNGIRAVTFDIGGTLIEPWPSVGHVYASVAARHGVNVSPEILNRQFITAWKSNKQFSHTLADWSAVVDATFDGLVSEPPSQTFFPELYESFSSPGAWRIFDDAIPCLETLRGRGFRLAAISNWDGRLRPLLDALRLAPYFETIVVSAEVGCGKPCSQMFEAAARQLQLPPPSILHVGDRRIADAQAARDFGFKSLLLRRSLPPTDESQIQSLFSLIA